MAQATIGGASPALATYMVGAIGEVSPGFYISVVSLLSLIGLRISPVNGLQNDSKKRTGCIKCENVDTEGVSDKTIGLVLA